MAKEVRERNLGMTERVLTWFWLLSVAFCFWGSGLLSVTLPGIGDIFPFRVFLPLTVLLYIVWTAKGGDHPWKDASPLYKFCYLFIAVMLIYGAVSLLFAMDFRFTFRRLFNLSFDMAFFYLMLRMCKDRKRLRQTCAVAGGSLAVYSVLGIIEVFSKGIFSPFYNERREVSFFGHYFQFPLVTAANTNDYCSAVLFGAAALLIIWGTGYRARKRLWMPLALLSVLFFLVSAADARLLLIASWLLLAGVLVFFFCADKKRLWVAALLLLIFGGMLFATDYEKIMARLPIDIPAATGDSAPAPTPPVPPEMTWKEEMEVGGSIGIRAYLLRFALDCFADSNGLGVGLGNTEQLAKINPDKSVTSIWSIHCFLARIVSDYGIFILIPLCAIAFLLLAAGFCALRDAIGRRDGFRLGLALLYLITLLCYPIVSTSSSDAQDIVPMWLYLAAIVLVSERLRDKETA